MSGNWEARALRFTPKPGRGMYHVLDVTSPTNKHKVELTESPTGKTFHIYVDGKRYVQATDGV